MERRIYPTGQRRAVRRVSKYPLWSLGIGEEFRMSITAANGTWSWRLYNRIRNAAYVHARANGKTFTVVQNPAYSKIGPWEAIVTRIA